MRKNVLIYIYVIIIMNEIMFLNIKMVTLCTLYIVIAEKRKRRRRREVILI